MARTVKAAEHAARRDAILDAAQRLILSNGYERLTVQDLLDDLQISKGAFYHYFDSKPAVIEALSARLVDDSARRLLRLLPIPSGVLSTNCGGSSAKSSAGNRRARTCLWRCCRFGMHPGTLSSSGCSWIGPWRNDWRRC